MKKIFNKKLYLIFVLFIFVIILIVSCKKINILGPNYIPPETDFTLPEDTIPAYIDVNPVPARDGEVFGDFQRKFKYKDKWYILANYMYNYDPKSKTLTQTARDIILQIDDNANIMIYDKDSRGYYDLLRMNIVEEDRVLYESSSYGDYSYSSSYFYTPTCGGVPYQHSFIASITFNNEIRTSSDLINWNTEGSNNNIYKKFPSVNINPNDSFQGTFGVNSYKIVEFKDYIYLIGLKEDFFEQNPEGCRNTSLGPFTVSKNVYYRIDKNKDTSVGSNWEKINTPWGQRSSLDVRYDEDKIYVTRGVRGYWENNVQINKWSIYYESFNNDTTIWSTTDGLTWQVEPNSSAYDNAEEISSYYSTTVGGDLPYIQNRVRTPEEPNWVKLNDGRYYKSDNSLYESYYLNGKYYYVPIPPYYEIINAYESGQEYFTITEEHMKTAGLNQFLTKDKEPNKDEGWTVITPIDYTDNLMVWQSGGEKVMLNINNKAVQLVDYKQIGNMYNTVSEYSTIISHLRKTAKELRDGTYYHPDYGMYMKDILWAMEYDARADMLELLMNNKEYIMPDEAITHYTVEFKY